MSRRNGTHFLDLEGKISDAKAILETYKDARCEAGDKEDERKEKRYEELIEKQEKYIEGLEKAYEQEEQEE